MLIAGSGEPRSLNIRAIVRFTKLVGGLSLYRVESKLKMKFRGNFKNGNVNNRLLAVLVVGELSVVCYRVSKWASSRGMFV